MWTITLNLLGNEEHDKNYWSYNETTGVGLMDTNIDFLSLCWTTGKWVLLLSALGSDQHSQFTTVSPGPSLSAPSRWNAPVCCWRPAALLHRYLRLHEHHVSGETTRPDTDLFTVQTSCDSGCFKWSISVGLRCQMESVSSTDPVSKWVFQLSF